jgi:twinkle protein
MAGIIPDTIDFSQYLRQTEAQLKVRPASVFADDVRASFAPRDRSQRHPSMFLAKLRDVLEFRPGEVTVWAGYNGHRKSMFTGQVALDLCMQRQRVLMASFEMQPARTIARMARQCLGVSQPAPTSIDAFSRWTDGRLWVFDHIGRISSDQCMAVSRYFAEELKGQHVFIDSMMMVCASEESLDEQKQFMTDTVRFAQETGLHVHLVAHCRKPQQGEDRPPTKYDLRGSAAISDQAHNVVTVWANKAKKQKPDDDLAGDPDALVTVEKQRNGSYEGKVKLWFDDSSLRFCDDRTSAVEPYVIREV